LMSSCKCGSLSRDAVKNKRGQKANNSFRHTFRHFGVRVELGKAGIRYVVDSTSRPVELALAVETNEVLTRETDCLDIAGPDHSVFFDVPHDLLEGLCHG